MISLLSPLKLLANVQSRIAELSTEKASYLLRLPYTAFKSLELLIFPKDLSLFHEGEVITKVKVALMVITTLGLIVSIIILIKKNRKMAGLMLFGLFSFIYAFSPIQIAWFIAERYLYLAAAAFCSILAITFVSIENKWKGKNIALTLTGILVIIYSVRTIIRNTEWRTRKSLWEATARVSPTSPRIYNNLGDVYIKEGDVAKSIKAFEHAIKLKPDYAEAYHNLGNTYLQLNQIETAKPFFEKALEINPNMQESIITLEKNQFIFKTLNISQATLSGSCLIKLLLTTSPEDLLISLGIKRSALTTSYSSEFKSSLTGKSFSSL